MTDSTSLSDFLVSALVTYGALALGLTLLLGAIGAPLPGSLVLVAAGAFARQDLINWQTALLLGLVGVVAGDCIAYGIGRVSGPWIDRRLGNTSAWKSATEQFERRGWFAVFITRFLLTPLGVPISFIAGIGSYVFWRFLLVDIAGEFLWLASYGTIGYLIGTQWEAAAQFLTDFSGLLVGVVALAVGAWLAVRMVRRRTDAAAEPAATLGEPVPE